VERELTLATLTLSACGPALVVAGQWLPAPAACEAGRDLERQCARRLWWPLVPAAVAFATLLGWGLQEPDMTSERLGPVACATAALFAALWARAVLRAVWSLLPFGARRVSGAHTAGLLLPRVDIEPHLRGCFDEAELEAVLGHERAHARHRDPLRIFLAQVVTDLQWPFPSAKCRLKDWRAALEIARDEEAREAGVQGEDLASAILKAARFGVAQSSMVAASLIEAPRLGVRIARLLEPVPEPRPRGSHVATWLLVGTIIAAVFAGHAFGEAVVRCLASVQP